jgi:ribonuclease HI
MTLRAFTDGASRGNPGAAGVGIIVNDAEGNAVLTLYGFIGVATNNVAEYTALVTLLERMKDIPCTKLIIHTDSELMARQMTGRYRVKDQGLKPLHARALRLMRALPFESRIEHVPREKNREADRLANRGIDEQVPLH